MKSVIFYVIFEINVAVSRYFGEVRKGFFFFFLSKSSLSEADTNNIHEVLNIHK